MKKVVLSLCVILTLLCSSCGWFGDQRYVCDVENVDSIHIVRLDEYVEEKCDFEYTVLVQISDCKTFANRLNEVKHSVNWGEPSPMELQYIAIKIDYSNGDFDLIHQDAQLFNRSGSYRTGYFFFDDEQFNSLISNYN